MNPRNATTVRPPTGLGQLLRHWRDARGKSQIDLSLDTGVSQRHISFIESGRSSPGRQTLLALAHALEVPFRDRNALLVAAGFAPSYQESPWNALEMGSVTRALERILRQQEPYPAVVMDRYWNVVMTNVSAPVFFNAFIDLHARPEPRNLLHLMFDPAGMRPFLDNWQEASASLIQRVHREATGHTLDERSRDLLAAVLAYPDVDPDPAAKVPGSGAALPMVPLTFRKDGHLLSYFSMVTTVGTPQTITTQELRIETMFPADEATEAAHRRLMAAQGASHTSA